MQSLSMFVQNQIRNTTQVRARHHRFSIPNKRITNPPSVPNADLWSEFSPNLSRRRLLAAPEFSERTQGPPKKT